MDRHHLNSIGIVDAIEDEILSQSRVENSPRLTVLSIAHPGLPETRTNPFTPVECHEIVEALRDAHKRLFLSRT